MGTGEDGQMAGAGPPEAHRLCRSVGCSDAALSSAPPAAAQRKLLCQEFKQALAF